uniref:homologous-pairing protein 2 homolog n=1 Tax=Styela clava TaxID=7725 RepID=UPI00193A1061|nr:homologous-pairing protein 2 homolog [Styela clava]
MGKEDKVETDVYEYMKIQNRPYSAADVFSNLHKVHGKTAVVKAMETLAVDKKLIEKAYGKSKIYVINQNEFPEVSDLEITKLEEDIKLWTEKCETSQSELKLIKASLRTHLSSLTTEDAKSKVNQLQKEVKQLKERLTKAKQSTEDISEEDKKNIYKNHKQFVSHWKKRKRMTTDLMEAVLEGYPKSKKVFIEEVGIETDEECNAKIPEV